MEIEYLWEQDKAVYAVSDLHGQYKTFTKGLKMIGFSDSDMLYVIGDAIDRGTDGIRILEYIKKHENMDLILGNHEFLMLNSVPMAGGPGMFLYRRYICSTKAMMILTGWKCISMGTFFV